MAKVKAVVKNATVDGKKAGEELTIEEADAKYLESIGYVEITGKARAPRKKATSSSSSPKSKDKAPAKETEKKAETKDK